MRKKTNVSAPMAHIALHSKSDRALFTYLAHARMRGLMGLGPSARTTRKELIRHLREQYNLTLRTAQRRIFEYLQEYTFNGRKFRYAEELDNGTIVRYGVRRFLDQITNRDLDFNFSKLTPQELDIGKAFRHALYRVVGMNPNQLGGEGDCVAIVSRKALTKATTVSKSTQRRIEKSKGIVSTPVFVQIIRPMGKDDSVKWLCEAYGQRVRIIDGRAMVQTRNAFYSEHMKDLVQRETRQAVFGERAADQVYFTPDVHSQRQLFVASSISAEDMKTLLSRGLDVDLWMRRGVDTETGEVIGRCVRFLAIDANDYSVAELAEAISAYQVNRHI